MKAALKTLIIVVIVIYVPILFHAMRKLFREGSIDKDTGER
jgi:hypothetical protein